MIWLGQGVACHASHAGGRGRGAARMCVCVHARLKLVRPQQRGQTQEAACELLGLLEAGLHAGEAVHDKMCVAGLDIA